MPNRKNEIGIAEQHEVEDSEFEEMLEDFFEDVDCLDKEVGRIKDSEPEELLYQKD